ncbi:uncharacterized protein LOC116350343 [Contarinia nasturtii]|uniref:uncharacterized protein LOC116350343 n=1 Tax=Contarinia nasturtii TaxID=265458 RepID=UPI0012D3C2CB|nr:uncharacterized protein LOC116350343 [Contarinia nasturtii]
MQPNRTNKPSSDRRNKQTDRLDRLNGEMENRQCVQILKKLYLNNETADIFFVFSTGDNESERVPAHKLILSAGSEGFNNLFATAEDGQIEFKLDDTTTAAFKEYLQFFYMPKVKLTFENFAVVLRLAKDYGNEDFLTICSHYLDHKLTAENIIWGYGLAIRYDRAILKKNCERRITESATDVLKSKSFLECDRDVLKHILQIDALKCYESQVLTGCLMWAKASAVQKNLDSTDTHVLRAELGDLLFEIRFKSMTMECFTLIVGSYGGFFSGPELEEIIQMITLSDYKSEKFNSKLRLMGIPANGDANVAGNSGASIGGSVVGGGGGGVSTVTSTKNRSGSNERNKHDLLHCNRIVQKSVTRYNIPKVEKTQFEANYPLLLHSFNCAQVYSVNDNEIKILIPTSVTIEETKANQTELIFSTNTTLSSVEESHVPLCCPIRIEPNRVYTITLELSGDVAHADIYTQTELRKFTELKNGTKVRFIPDPDKGFDTTKVGLVQRLVFKRT